MAYREVGMVQVREIVWRWLAGDGLRSIARALGVDSGEDERLAAAKGILEFLRSGPPFDFFGVAMTETPLSALYSNSRGVRCLTIVGTEGRAPNRPRPRESGARVRSRRSRWKAGYYALVGSGRFP